MIKWLKNICHKSSRNCAFMTYDSFSEPVWMSQNYASLSNEGYQKNIIVYRCVNLISKSISSVRLVVYDNDHELCQHPLVDLLNNPNPGQSKSTFLESVIGSLLISGNAYINVICNDENTPCELYNLRPDRVSVIAGKGGIVESYKYCVNGKSFLLQSNEDLSKSSVIHLKLFNPLDDFYGLSPICAAAKSIDQHNAVSGHNLSLLQNGGRPSGCLMVKNAEYELSNEQRVELKEKIQEAYQGTMNSGKIMILEGDFEWKEMGLSPKDMDFIAGKKLSAREISQAYGVPPILVGIEGDATFSNYKEARFHFWEDTILPMLDYVINEFNMWLSKRYGKDLLIKYDEDSIAALTPKREKLWKKISSASFLTLNEKRQALGYSPIDGLDKL